MGSTGSVAGEPPLYFGTPGATGVWAPENTREEIFDGIRRKETLGTSWPLIRVRFFGGWDFDDDLTEDRNFVKKAYASGVPMGGDLPAKPDKAKAPTFAVWTLKDPDTALVDFRCQGIRHRAASRGRRHDPGTCLVIADLVHTRSEPREATRLLPGSAGRAAARRWVQFRIVATTRLNLVVCQAYPRGGLPPLFFGRY